MNTNPAIVRKPLAPGQLAVYVAILKRWSLYGVPPTVRDLMRDCGIASPNGVVNHLKALRRKGWLTEHRPDTARDIIPCDLIDSVRENAAVLLDLLGMAPSRARVAA